MPVIEAVTSTRDTGVDSLQSFAAVARSLLIANYALRISGRAAALAWLIGHRYSDRTGPFLRSSLAA
jgi:hypothetical protein